MTDPIAVAVGMALADLRQLRNLTQAEVARQLGITQGNYSRWESGSINLTVDDMVRAADVLKFPPAKLFHLAVINLPRARRIRQHLAEVERLRDDASREAEKGGDREV